MIAPVKMIPRILLFVPIVLALVSCTRFSGNRGVETKPLPRASLLAQAQPKAVAALPVEALEKILVSEKTVLDFAGAGMPDVWTAGALRGSVTASQPFRVGGRDCRRLDHSIVGPNPTEAAFVACRLAGGWELVG